MSYRILNQIDDKDAKKKCVRDRMDPTPLIRDGPVVNILKEIEMSKMQTLFSKRSMMVGLLAGSTVLAGCRAVGLDKGLEQSFGLGG